MANPFQILTSDDSILNRVQKNILAAFNAVSGPFIGGNLLTNVTVNTTATVINHGLVRTPQVWVVTDQNTLATVKRVSWNTNSITLEASTDCVISLWVN